MTKNLLFLTSFLFFPILIVAQNFQESITNIAENNNLVGISVGVVCNSEIVDCFNFGKADIARNIDINQNTMFRIASISKSVTATALMILHSQNRFNLDDNISDYLGYNVVNPNFPNKNITFRMLLSHTSSLVDGDGYFNFLSDTYNLIPPPNIKNLLQTNGSYHTADLWLNQSPGTYFSYSNINYAVIATLIEKISGIRFDNFVEQNILAPLNIEGHFNVAKIENINNVAVLYRNSIPQADNYQGISPLPFDSTNYTIGDNGLIFAPQGGLRISTTDLCKFMIMQANYGKYQNSRIVDSATIALMHQPQWTYNGVNGNNYYNLFNCWGLGFHITTNAPAGDIVIENEIMTGHPGEAYGLISDMYFETNKKFGLIFITNGYHGNSYYNTGNNSAFYVPEEQVFESINSFYYQYCETLPTAIEIFDEKCNSQNSDFYFDQHSKNVLFSQNISNGVLNIYNTAGIRINSYSVENQIINISCLKTGMYIFKFISENHSTSKKIMIIE